MPHRLVADRQEENIQHPRLVRMAAAFFSYLFHPVFIPVLVVAFMLFVHPYLFTGLSPFDKSRVLVMSVLMYTFFPVVTVLLLKALKFIGHIQLKTQKDRIIPLIASMTWYAWLAYVWWNSHKMSDALAIPKEAFRLALAVFLASWLALMANIKIKVSLHAIACGVMLAFIILLAFSQNLNFGIYISAAFIITGIVCTARFIVSDHTPLEIYGGLALGVAAQVIAWQFG